jgi:DNA-binding GntR family transcriptional regulator
MSDNQAPKTKKEQIADMLRDVILAGELLPGERLLQDQLARRFDVSPTPVREAIQQLVAEGVLVHNPYRGVQVAEANMDDVHEVYLIRSVLEELATREAVPNLRIVDLRRLHELHDLIGQAATEDDRQLVRKHNFELHWLIYNSCGLPHPIQMLRTLWSKSPLDTLPVLPTRPQEAVVEHARLLEAIDAGDAERAGQRMREHIQNGETTLVQHLKTLRNQKGTS